MKKLIWSDLNIKKSKSEGVTLIGENTQKLLSNLCNWKKKKFFLVYYKMVLKNTKETWEKCGIKTVKHYKERENIIELW